jgi:aminoglycoside 6'-N-acetyltransferase I
VSKITIRAARAGDQDALAEMQFLLWPDASLDELLREVEEAIGGHTLGTLPEILLVSESEEDGLLSGFVAVGLRSHAEGCDPTHPVGYVEGWFVREAVRGRGIGRALIDAAEAWARGQGCHDMASDAQIDNLPSQHAHRALGFELVERSVHFRKSL